MPVAIPKAFIRKRYYAASFWASADGVRRENFHIPDDAFFGIADLQACVHGTLLVITCSADIHAVFWW